MPRSINAFCEPWKYCRVDRPDSAWLGRSPAREPPLVRPPNARLRPGIPRSNPLPRRKIAILIRSQAAAHLRWASNPRTRRPASMDRKAIQGDARSGGPPRRRRDGSTLAAPAARVQTVAGSLGESGKTASMPRHPRDRPPLDRRRWPTPVPARALPPLRPAALTPPDVPAPGRSQAAGCES